MAGASFDALTAQIDFLSPGKPPAAVAGLQMGSIERVLKTRSLPHLAPVDRLGLVDLCLITVFPWQITANRQQTVQLRKENPKRLCCSPRPSADRPVLFSTRCNQKPSRTGPQAFLSC